MGFSMKAACLAVLAAAVVLVFAGAAGGATYTRFLASPSVCPNQSKGAATVREKRRAMGCLVNHARRKRGLAPLALRRKLNRAGALKLADNVRCDEFSHTACGKPFISVFRRSGYVTASSHGFAVGENLAWGQGRLGTPRRTLLAWLRSDSHRHNLFSRTWREMGIAYRSDTRFEGYEDVVLWANEFGRR